MRALLLSLLVVTGCSATTDPCAGKSGICIGLHVTGAIAKLDQLAFSIREANTAVVRTPNPAASFVLPVKVALFPPAGTTGTVHVSADAYDGGSVVGHGEVDAPLVNGRAQETLTLVAAGGGTDMSRADLAGLDLAGSSDLAQCNNVSQCVAGDGCCPTGCNGSTDSDCPSVCGNSIIEPGEVCDDGNHVNGDGCDPTCHWSGAVTEVTGIAGSSSHADGPASRFETFSGIATDGTTLWVYDADTIRVMGMTPTTIIGAGYDVRVVDGAFADARIGGGGGNGIVYLGGKLYFVDSNMLRVADLTSKMVSTLSASVIQNSPIALTTDGTSLFYLGMAGELDKWTPGAATSTQLIAAGAISAVGSSCTSLVRSQGMTYLGCSGAILQATDAGAVTIYAGSSATPPATCSDNASRTAATFAKQNFGMTADSAGNLYVSSCAAVREINASGVNTVAGVLNMPGFSPDPPNQFGATGSTAAMMLLWSTAKSTLYLADSDNAELFSISGSFVQLLGGSTPHRHDTSVRGTGAVTAFTLPYSAGVSGLVTDGTYAYLLSGATLTRVKLATGDSVDLFTFSGSPYGKALTRIGTTLYAALNDGSIHSIGVDGTGDTIFAGMGGMVTSPSSNGTPGDLRSVVMGPTAVTTDGTDLYYVDGLNLIKKIDLATATASTIAGTDGTTDVLDGTGPAAHFNFASDLAYANGHLYTMDGPVGCCIGTVREINIASGVVRLLAGQETTSITGLWGDVDGLGSAGIIAAGHHLGTDGSSLFISDVNKSANVWQGVAIGPTIRQVEIKTQELTTTIGTRGQWTETGGIGTKALVNSPGPIAFDATTHSLVFFDLVEGVLMKIK